MDALVTIQAIRKSYPGVQALKGVDLEVRSGRVHCIVGENGAGKSTLVRILAGAEVPDGGSLQVLGRAHEKLNPAEALALGIGLVHQEIDLVPAMTVAENIFLGHEPIGRAGFLDRGSLRKRAARLLENFDLDIDPDDRVDGLGPAQQQLVQIAKALSRDQKVLIFDEPTASLTDNEVEHLFRAIRRFREQGRGIVYISHRLPEIRELGEDLTVLRDGATVFTGQVADISDEQIIGHMVGRPLANGESRARVSGGEVALDVRGLSRRGVFSDISLDVCRGEIVALAGLVGAGRSDVLHAIFGLEPADTGSIEVDGQPVIIGSPRQAIRLGLGLVPEERRTAGLIVQHSVGSNLVLTILERLSRMIGFDRRGARRVQDRLTTELMIKTSNLNAAAATLSGGNQQKIVIGKWLAAGTRVLLLDEPTRGVDVHAKAEIYRLLRQLTGQGLAVLMVSSDLPEVLAISDRVVVMSGGRRTAEYLTARTSQAEIMQSAVARSSLR